MKWQLINFSATDHLELFMPIRVITLSDYKYAGPKAVTFMKKNTSLLLAPSLSHVKRLIKAPMMITMLAVGFQFVAGR